MDHRQDENSKTQTKEAFDFGGITIIEPTIDDSPLAVHSSENAYGNNELWNTYMLT